jgi:hypothetical protein
MKRLAALAGWLALIALSAIWPANAQDAPSKVRQSWLMQSKLTSAISVTTSSAATQLPATGLTLWACNTGANDAYLTLGSSNAVTTTIATGSWLKASTCTGYDLYPPGLAGPYTWIALIGSGGATVVYVEAGMGTPPAALASSGGGGGGGGAVTVADGADVALGLTTQAPASVPTSGTGATLIELTKALVNLINTNTVTLGPATAANSVPITPGAITPVVSAAAESSHVLKASAGNFYSAYATNLTTTAGFLLIFNATSAPADGAVTPLACVPLPASGNGSINNKPGPYQVYSTGITAVVSSAATCFTKTTGVITAFISGDVQ